MSWSFAMINKNSVIVTSYRQGTHKLTMSEYTAKRQQKRHGRKILQWEDPGNL